MTEKSDLIPGVYEGGLKVWECSVDLAGYIFHCYEFMDRDKYGESFKEVVISEGGIVVSTGSEEDGGDGSSADDDVNFGGGYESDFSFYIEGIENYWLQSMQSSAEESMIYNGREFHILEIGAGHALPTISAISTFSKYNTSLKVTVSDFNEDVLSDVTVQNFVVNGVFDNFGVTAEDVTMYYGDWFNIPVSIANSNFNNKNENITDDTSMEMDGEVNADSNGNESGGVDLFLSSETTYTLDSCVATAKLLSKHLKTWDFGSSHEAEFNGSAGMSEELFSNMKDSEDVTVGGIALISTKRFYFGVGGGSDSLISSIAEVNSGNKEEELVVFGKIIYDSGVGNIREIVKVFKRVKYK